MRKSRIKDSVRSFYDRVGWQPGEEGLFQNAQYEDLREVSRDYIQKCHMRVNRYLAHSGKYFLDAGSGPIQYPVYMTYSQGYDYRVCLDISIVALQAARDRVGGHGLYVVGDIANLPFASDVFTDLVSLHAIHHLPAGDYRQAYRELRRALRKKGVAVVVNGWESSRLMNWARLPLRFMERFFGKQPKDPAPAPLQKESTENKPEGTFVNKLDAAELKRRLGDDFPIQIRVWRSVSVRFLRAMIHPALLGRFWLKILFLKEEIFPKFFGEKGQYPLITFTK